MPARDRLLEVAKPKNLHVGYIGVPRETKVIRTLLFSLFGSFSPINHLSSPRLHVLFCGLCRLSASLGGERPGGGGDDDLVAAGLVLHTRLNTDGTWVQSCEDVLELLDSRLAA